MSITTKYPQTAAGPVAGDHEQELTKEERRQRQIKLNQPTIALLKSWLEDEHEDSEEDQRAALEWLMAALDEDRPSDRKLLS